MWDLLERWKIDRFVRFLVGGAVNTLITWALFLVLSDFLHLAVAYTIAYASGIAIAYAIAATFVFGTGFDARSALRFPSVYVIQYLYGLAVLSILIDDLEVPRQAAVLVVIVTSIPLTFILSKHALGGASSAPPSSHGRKPAATRRLMQCFKFSDSTNKRRFASQRRQELPAQSRAKTPSP
jgi:putative flippase GtrA